ncbi:methyl-accepting chemotaxis protein McpA [Clostridium puniceum]|uniref:Methyl-accepting chemotaxis protein McpA n=1 Tax=Clostridium puniceum TaxID=29367 RepID=A0A1S8T7Q3_9CLOT|nr:methyl-accepting chemotaxis protein [Clostridium puniceum]OOM73659.1 methyl-accepting chemotaxis protein McpA [Clostridium puniceum]
MNIENREELLNATNLIGISTDQAFNSVEKLSTLAGKLANHQSILRNLSKEIETSISETKNIIEFIQGISKTTKILSFNAAIESSKAGEAGRGFSVVSSEMRKMAENTGSSAKNIELVLENIKAKIFEISKEIDKTANISEQQEDIAEEISSIINELVSSTEILNKSASKYN